MRLLLADLLGVVIMNIKEFFVNCTYCRHVWIYICCKDESGGCQFDAKAICNFKDLDDFIDDYGDEEIASWSVENAEKYTEITFYFKG